MSFFGRLALLALTFVGPSATAQDRFADDFESGLFLQSEGGKWDSWDICPSAPVVSTMALSADAAHRGDWGMRLVDTSSEPGNGGGCDAFARARFSPAITGQAHLRFWVRLNWAASAPGMDVAAFISSTPAAAHGALLDASAVPQASCWWVHGADNTRSDVAGECAGALYAPNTWHLVEASIEGLGTADGVRRLWFDGRPAGEQTGLSFLHQGEMRWEIGQLGLGEVYAWSSRAGTGTIDFDDVRLGPRPHASTVTLRFSDEAAAERGCTALQVVLLTSEGQRGQAPYDVRVAPSAGTSWFSDPACRESLVEAIVPTGAQTSDSIFVRPEPAGVSAFAASAIDFLSSTPPVMRTTPNPDATVGEPYRYSARGVPDVQGRGPYRYRASSGSPTGFSVDPDSGRISWTPSSDQQGTQRVGVAVESASGVAVQSWTVQVAPGTPQGCASAPAAAGGLPFLLAWLWLRRRRAHPPPTR